MKELSGETAADSTKSASHSKDFSGESAQPKTEHGAPAAKDASEAETAAHVKELSGETAVDSSHSKELSGETTAGSSKSHLKESSGRNLRGRISMASIKEGVNDKVEAIREGFASLRLKRKNISTK